jgi:hypothetical protein
MSEAEMVRNIISNSANGYGSKNNLEFDGDSKCFRPRGSSRNPDSSLSVGANDTKFST